MAMKTPIAELSASGVGDVSETQDGKFDFPLERSVGYQIRMTYRYFAQDLQNYLEQHDLPIGMWYFLRVLWEEDGLTQRELSERVGSAAPSTVEQLRNMERKGLITRRRSNDDRRKNHVFLTAQGRVLRRTLLPYAAQVNATALEGLSEGEIGFLRLVLSRMRENLARCSVRASEESSASPPKGSAMRRSAR